MLIPAALADDPRLHVAGGHAAERDRLGTGAVKDPARNRLETANANSMEDLTKAMRANPRFARLVKLAGERNCSV